MVIARESLVVLPSTFACWHFSLGTCVGCSPEKIGLHPVVSKFGGFIVNMFSQSSTQFQRGNFNSSYTTALTVLEGQPSSGVFVKFLSLLRTVRNDYS